TPGTAFDQLAVNGTIALGGNLTVNASGTPAVGTQFLIVDNDGTDPVTGRFAGLPANGSTLTSNGTTFSINYDGGTNNNDVVLTVTVAAAPRVTDVTVNAGQANLVQRSRVTSIAVAFSTAVTFGGTVAAAF